MQKGQGAPGVILAAMREYDSRVADLARIGITDRAAHESILREARERGGVLRPGESIDLSAWLPKRDPRLPPLSYNPVEVLEALVLAILHAAPVDEQSAATAAVATVDAAPGTPASVAMETPGPNAVRAPAAGTGPKSER
jgi:hypothetical protein